MAQKVYKIAVLTFATFLMLLIDLGVPFIITCVGIMVGLWQWSWGIMFVWYAILQAWSNASDAYNWLVALSGGDIE